MPIVIPPTNNPLFALLVNLTKKRVSYTISVEDDNGTDTLFILCTNGTAYVFTEEPHDTAQP